MLIGARRTLLKPRAAAIASSKTYTFRGSNFSATASEDQSASFDIGTATATRLVIVAVVRQNDRTPTTIKVNGIDLAQIAATINGVGGNRMQIWSGTVNSGSGSQTIAIDYPTGAFEACAMHVWTADGLSSNTPATAGIKSGAGSTSVSVQAGDFMFSVSNSVTTTEWNGSTEAPDASRADSNPLSISGDWQINATNAAFSFNNAAAVNSSYAVWR